MEMLKGNAVVGQSGGPTAAINASLAGVIEGAFAMQKEGIINTLYGMKNGMEGLLAEDLCNLFEAFATEQSLALLRRTPSSALGSCRYKLPTPEKDEAGYEEVLRIFKKYDIRYFFYIGGNDSMDAVDKLTRFFASRDYAVRIVGVPKTIDNDLVVTDHTPGFGSAAKYIATTMHEILRDCAVYRVRAVTIVEIMGRDAGWLTASAALPAAVGAPAPDLIYLPERPFSMDAFFADLRKAFEKHPNIVVAVSEGIRTADGEYVGAGTQSGAVDSFGHRYLAGTAKALELAVKAEFGCKVRSIELNLPQRCASHLASLTDIEESAAVGFHAVRAACAGESGCMATILRAQETPYRAEYGTTPVSAVANQVKTVPASYINEEGNGITEEGLAYLLPLIQGELTPVFRDGLPVHIIL